MVGAIVIASGLAVSFLLWRTVGGETFTLGPGDVLIAEDHTGSGHKWRLLNDEPWKRAYVVFKEGADTQFTPEASRVVVGVVRR